MLGPDHQDAVEADHQLRMVRGPQTRGERVGQLVGIAGQLVDDAARPFAGEHGDRVVVVGERRG